MTSEDAVNGLTECLAGREVLLDQLATADAAVSKELAKLLPGVLEMFAGREIEVAQVEAAVRISFTGAFKTNLVTRDHIYHAMLQLPREVAELQLSDSATDTDTALWLIRDNRPRPRLVC